jgi:hypothetical protein
MKGIVLAGGTGSRLFPLTKVTNKHLLPVGKHPMLIHPIFKLRDAGIEQILIVTGTEHGDRVPLLAQRTGIDGRPAAYVCRGMVCERPVVDPEELAELLGRAVTDLRAEASAYTPGEGDGPSA